ncbi:MAG TPA: hypothetical protein VI790_01145 [Candidatus Nanoarchaeia archaeon]|nr:hypothetical protein [Candidatus Nanoarchaeia archaeon]
MKELSVYFDNDHLHPELGLNQYLASLNKPVRGVIVEMTGYDGLEADLLKMSVGSDYGVLINNYPDKKPRFFTDSLISIFDFVLANNTRLFYVGTEHDDIRRNISQLLPLSGLYPFIIGIGHEDFVKSELEPILKRKFDVVTYSSSSCPSCSK